MHQAPKWLVENLTSIVEWLEQAYPEEGCGLVLETSDGFRWLPCENLANRYHELDPATYPRTAETFYIVNPMEFVKAEDRGEKVAVVVHSHADVGDYFSDEDVAGALVEFEGEAQEPSHPGVDYLVVSVRDGQADALSLFRFDSSEDRNFARVYRGELRREQGGAVGLTDT